jgi:hypothetical protein
MVNDRRHVRYRLMNGTAPAVLALVAGFALVSGAPVSGARADETDPPSRVGRIAVVAGTVSFHPSPDEQWTPAQANIPVAQSTAIWADSDGGATIEIGDSRIQLDHNTELDVVQLDDDNVVLSVPQGRVDIAVHNKPDTERYDVQTARGDVDLLADGTYRVFAGTDSDPTRIAGFNGSAELAGTTSEISIAANQEIVAQPGPQVAYSVSTPVQDDFDRRFLGEIQTVYARPPVPSYVPPMPGVSVLGEYGAWQEHPQYGHVWFPTQVEAGWAPYRHGHWGYVAPWGYTWIDDAPWGFAPFHYGRWVEVGGRWGWVAVEPGVTWQPGFRPVYAPAMVAFIGNPAALTVGIGGIGVSVGWVPLGPGEPWHPWYHCSDNYLRQANIVSVNRTTITNITTVNNTTINNITYANQRAATVVPQTAFAGGERVSQAAYHIPPANLAKPIAFEPVRPNTVERALPAPSAAVFKQPAHLPPAPKLAMPHPAPASAAAFHAHPPAAVAVHTAVPKPGSNVVPKEALPPPAKHTSAPAAAHPAAEPAKPGEAMHPAEPAKPGVGRPTEPVKPEVAKPEAAKPEVAKPEAAKPAAEPAKPSAPEHPAAKPAEHPAEPAKPEVTKPEAAKPAEHAAEPAKPAAHPAEAEHPAAKPAEHPAEPAKPAVHPAEPAKPAAHPAEAEHPAAKPAEHPAEPAKPAVHPAEPAKPAAHPAEHAAEPARPAAHPAEHAAEPAKPAPHPAEPAKPAAEPAHPAAAHPAEAPKPAAEPKKEQEKKTPPQ